MKSNDSIIELKQSSSSDISLVIIQEQFGNLGRFLSGINDTKNNTRKQNVYSLRVKIEGSIHVLLLAKRYIKKGELLYYDYNAGEYNAYNISSFE